MYVRARYTSGVSAYLQVMACVQDPGLCVRMPTADCPLAMVPSLLTVLPRLVASCI